MKKRQAKKVIKKLKHFVQGPNGRLTTTLKAFHTIKKQFRLMESNGKLITSYVCGTWGGRYGPVTIIDLD